MSQLTFFTSKSVSACVRRVLSFKQLKQYFSSKNLYRFSIGSCFKRRQAENLWDSWRTSQLRCRSAVSLDGFIFALSNKTVALALADFKARLWVSKCLPVCFQDRKPVPTLSNSQCLRDNDSLFPEVTSTKADSHLSTDSPSSSNDSKCSLVISMNLRRTLPDSIFIEGRVQSFCKRLAQYYAC